MSLPTRCVISSTDLKDSLGRMSLAGVGCADAVLLSTFRCRMLDESFPTYPHGSTMSAFGLLLGHSGRVAVLATLALQSS